MAGPINSNSITVTTNTGLRELQDFANRAGDQSKLRAKEIEPGKFILYESGKKASIFSKLSGRDEAKTEAARKAVSLVLGNAHHSGASAAMTDVRNLVTGRDGSLRRLELGDVVDHAILLEGAARSKFRGDMQRVGPQQLNAPKVAPRVNDGPGLAKLGKADPMVTSMAKDIANILRSGKPEHEIKADLSALAKTKGNELAGRVTAHMNKIDIEAFALSPGKGFRQDLTEALRNTATFVKTDEPHIRDFLRETYNVAAGKVAPNTFDEKNTKLMGFGDLKLVEQEKLGEGGFATVVHYTCTTKDDNNNDIEQHFATKFTLDPTRGKNIEIKKEQNQANLIDEATVHLKACQMEHPNIVKAEGLVRAEGGKVGLVMEMAPYQSANEAIAILKEAKFSPEVKMALVLTIAKDIFSGVDHLQNVPPEQPTESDSDETIIHMDLKPQNIILCNGGIGKITDFGTSKLATEYKFDYTKDPVDCPYWKAPELCVQKMNIRNAMTQAGLNTDVNIKGLTKLAADNVEIVFGNLRTDKMKNNVKDILVAPEQDAHDLAQSGIDRIVKADRMIDNWSAGVILFNLCMGRDMLKPEWRNAKFFTEIEDDLVAFVSNPNNKALDSVNPDGTITKGYFGSTTGDPQVDELINSLLTSRDQRAEMEDVLNHPALSRDEVGSGETRDLLMAVMNKDPDDNTIQNSLTTLVNSIPPQVPQPLPNVVPTSTVQASTPTQNG